jgi:serine/threonine protein kinase
MTITPEPQTYGEPSPGGPLQLGTLVAARYRIEECLSETTHARVYKVTDIKTGSLRVLKCSRDGSPRYARILVRERAVTSSVNHTAVVHIHDGGDLPNGDAFYVADWIDGESIARILRGGPIIVPHALQVLGAIMPALAELHILGHIHLDLKPENVIVPHALGGYGYSDARLLDFGNHLTLSISGDSCEPRSLGGRIGGSLAYMAPEQFLGQPQTTATDVYGLGALLFAMLFCRPVRSTSDIVEGKDESGCGPRVFVGPGVARCVSTEIELPMTPEISPELRVLVSRMLRVDPRTRPPSIAAVAAEIEGLPRVQQSDTHSRVSANRSDNTQG